MSPRELFEALQSPLFHIGDSEISVFSITIAGLWLAAIIVFAGIVRRRILRRVLARTHLDQSVQFALLRLINYVVLFLGFIIGLPLVGIDLSSLAVLLGALGIGIGFGLQSVAANFVSGLIILFQRPIKIGDRVEIGGAILGDVVDIRAYSTTIRTNDNIDIIVPNAKIISDQIVNWSHNDPRVRVHVHVGVSYDTEPKRVEAALLEVAGENPDVLPSPEPTVIFRRFGESSLEFDLRVWTTSMLHRPGAFRSGLHFAIWEKFRQLGIEMPLPQRDLHLRSLSSEVRDVLAPPPKT